MLLNCRCNLKSPRGALVRLSVWGADSMRLNRRYATSDTSQNCSGFSVHAVVFWEFLTANDNPLGTVRTMGVIIMGANGAERFSDCLQTCFYITTWNENVVLLVIMHVLLFLSNFMFPLIVHVPECEHWISNIIWMTVKGLFLKLAKAYYRLRLWHLCWLWRFPDVLMLSHTIFWKAWMRRLKFRWRTAVECWSKSLNYSSFLENFFW